MLGRAPFFVRAPDPARVGGFLVGKAALEQRVAEFEGKAPEYIGADSLTEA